MQFVETSIFTRQVVSLLTDDEYSQLQIALVAHPEIGSIIPHSGGLRKVRWSMSGRGKRGGVLTRQQLKVLREIVEKEFK